MNNIITNIELCKKNKERSNIYIDNEFAFAMSNEIIYKFHLKIKSNIDIKATQKEIDKLSKELRLVDNSIQEINWTVDLL